MGRAPCCDKIGLRRGRWTAQEDEILSNYINVHGEGSWRSLPKNAGLLRCGKSCRLRWINYLRSDLKRGKISGEEKDLIIKLHASFGNRWSMIAGHLAGRTDNEIKNYWNSHLSPKITPSSPKITAKHRNSAVKIKKPRKKASMLSPEKQVSMINSPSNGGGGGEVMHDSSTSGGVKAKEINDCFYDESLLMDPINGVVPLSDHKEDDVINNMYSSSSSTNGSSQVNEVDWGWEWDFEDGDSMVGQGLGLGGEEEDDIMSWPWESQEEQVGVDVKKQDAMIAWLLS